MTGRQLKVELETLYNNAPFGPGLVATDPQEAQGDHSLVTKALARMVRNHEFTKIVALLDDGDTHG